MSEPLRRLPLGWLLGGLAALTAIGLSIAALVVANDNSPVPAAVAAGGVKSCSATTVAEQELPSVVTIRVAGTNAAGTGSGEVIDGKGHILTNNHVIAAAASGGTITVVFSDGRAEQARLVGRDPTTDLAVLQVAEPSGLTPMTFGSSKDLQVGQPVIALGAPLGLSSSVTAGIVSALDRSVDLPADNGATAILVAAIQTDAAINPGNSGGALVDCAGHLVGVPTAGATVPNEDGSGSSGGNIGIGFAIPSDFAKTISDELIATGQVRHGFLGVSVMTAGGGGQPTSAPGLYVASVVPAGPAAQAGLMAGDVITEVDGTPATNAEQLLALTVANRPGEKVALTVNRQGVTRDVTVTLGSK